MIHLQQLDKTQHKQCNKQMRMDLKYKNQIAYLYFFTYILHAVLALFLCYISVLRSDFLLQRTQKARAFNRQLLIESIVPRLDS